MFPEGASTIADDIDLLFAVIHLIGGLAGLVAAVWIIDSLIRYRRSHRRPTVASGVPDSKRGAVITLILSVLSLTLIGIWSQIVWDDITRPPVEVVDTIRVAPRQFQWDVRYAGSDRIFETDDDPTWINRLVLPRDRAVRIELRGADVIHSFFIPEFRIKRDAVPGTTSVIWVTPTREGSYELVCTEYCGLGHYRMRGVVEVVSFERYRRWRDSVSAERSAGVASLTAEESP